LLVGTIDPEHDKLRRPVGGLLCQPRGTVELLFVDKMMAPLANI
jgi:hypothetical protein